jgi:hypothetical protein
VEVRDVIDERGSGEGVKEVQRRMEAHLKGEMEAE